VIVRIILVVISMCWKITVIKIVLYTVIFMNLKVGYMALLLSESEFLVPTLCVGIRIAPLLRCDCCDAERHVTHSHAGAW